MMPPSFSRRSILLAAAAGSASLGCSDKGSGPQNRNTTTGTGSRNSIATPRPLPTRRPNANPYLAENFAPVAQEVSRLNLDVAGNLPAALSGTFMRVGPNPTAMPEHPERYSWFPGAGMIHGVQIDGGRAIAYRNRYVRTTSISTGFRESPVPGPAPVGFDASNTNVVEFRGRILTCTEGSLPYVVTADGSTIERTDFPGGLSHGLSAHCKFDPATGELHNVSYRVAPTPYAVWQVIDADGKVDRTVPIELDVAGMWHTFSLTDRYVIVYDHPVVYDPTRLADGWLFPFAWHGERPGRVGLIERTGDGRVRWFVADLGSVNHDVAAHDTPTGVSVLFTSSERQFDRDPAGPLEAPPILVRLEIDTGTGKVRRTVVDERAQEFPRSNPDLGLGKARFVYTIGAGPGVSGGGVLEPGNAILNHDLVKSTTEVAPIGPTRATAEAVFVADPERTRQEDGGWLLSYVYDAQTDLSDLVVVDAQDISAGPVATVSLAARVPWGFHGNWMPAD